MKNIKLFDTHSEYRSYINGTNAVHRNVSYCRDMNEVHFDRRYYEGEYLTTEALEDGTISFNIWYSMGTDMITSISYSTDNGDTWTTTNNTNNKSENLQISVNVEEGDKVLWKGDATQTGYFDEDDWTDTVGSFFSSDCEYNVYGNVMSLLHGDNFYGETSLGNTEYTFAYLFYNYNDGEAYPIVSAEHLILPATTLTNGCYFGMFNSCTSLTIPPVLPATTLATYCYTSMFYGCTALTTAPALPATTLADYCYYAMFRSCTALTTAPVLPAITLANYCYNSMFRSCTALTAAPKLPATTLVIGCYENMFYGCTSLTTAPVLPATTLANGCYLSMFSGCASLTTAPALPATTLVTSCYQSMFYGCTSLTTAPVLPATTLANSCYNYMFQNCSNLNYIKAMFTTTPSTTYTNQWVQGVAATGTFVKNSAAQWSMTGVNGVPSGWTVQTASE